jgi:hypothetical protein
MRSYGPIPFRTTKERNTVLEAIANRKLNLIPFPPSRVGFDGVRLIRNGTDCMAPARLCFLFLFRVDTKIAWSFFLPQHTNKMCTEEPDLSRIAMPSPKAFPHPVKKL